MNESKHTAIPWQTGTNYLNRGVIYGGMGTVAECELPARLEAEANAAFIVEACNNYDALKARNAELIQALKDYHDFILENFSEFDSKTPCDPDDNLCPKCELNGCINLKIANARAALDKKEPANG